MKERVFLFTIKPPKRAIQCSPKKKPKKRQLLPWQHLPKQRTKEEIKKRKKKILKEADGTTERRPETSCELIAGGFNWLTKTRNMNTVQPGMLN